MESIFFINTIVIRAIPYNIVSSRSLAVCKRGNPHTGTGFRVVQCAERPDCTPVRGTGFWFWVRSLAVCKRLDLHTGTGYGVLGSGFGASRCAKGSICTPLRGYRSRGVQKVRFAHRDGGSGSCTLTRWCVQVLMDSIPELWLRTHGID